MKYAAPWLLLAAVISVAAYVTYRLNRGREALAEVARLKQQDLAAAKGQLVERDATIAELTAQVTELRAKQPKLDAAVAKAECAAPGAHPVEVIVARTVDAPVPAAPKFSPGANSACILEPGDKLRAEVAQVVEEYSAGARAVAGVVTVRRTWPGPEVALLEEPFSAPVSGAHAAPPEPALARWGAGVAVFGDGLGLGYGLSVSPPPVALFGVELELGVSAGLGVGGPRGLVTALARP